MESNQHAHLRAMAGIAGRANAAISRSKAIAAYHANPNVCKECSTPILVRDGEKITRVRQKVYCTRTCAAHRNNKAFPKRQHEGRCKTCRTAVKAAWAYCEICRSERPKPKPRGSAKMGAQRVRRKGTPTRPNICPTCSLAFTGCRRYCSTQCRPNNTAIATARRAVFIEAWKAGDIDGGKCDYQVSRCIRIYLFQKHDSKCSQCGWSERNPLTGRVPLHVDHIDGDWRNHREENLRLICPNCHSLTPTYGSLNKGRGRPYRKATIQNTIPLR